MKKKVTEFMPDPMNVNKHSEFGSRLLENSLRENGFGRSIVVSRDNVIIAGNGVQEAAVAIGMEDAVVVESDGKKLIIVKRNDIVSGTKEFYKAAMADNVVAQKNIVFDLEVVEAVAQEFPEVKPWASIVLPEEGPTDKDRANVVQFKALLSSKQYETVKKAMKLGKQKFKDAFQKNENEEEQGNTLFHICQEFLKNNK